MPYALVPQKRYQRLTEDLIGPDLPDSVSWVGQILSTGDYLLWALGVTEQQIPKRFRITYAEAVALYPLLIHWTVNGQSPTPDN